MEEDLSPVFKHVNEKKSTDERRSHTTGEVRKCGNVAVTLDEEAHGTVAYHHDEDDTKTNWSFVGEKMLALLLVKFAESIEEDKKVVCDKVTVWSVEE